MLQTLHTALSTTEAAALSQAKAIYGLGGVGKTQTAVEYAYRYHEAYDWVFWVKADTDLNLATDFGKIASAVGLPQIVGQSLDETVQAVRRWFETNNRWLLIFDNADTPAWLKLYRPNNPNGRILITSRAQVFDSLDLAQPLEVEKLSHKEAVEFLYKRTERSQAQSAEVAAAEALAKELDYLPIVLEQAGAYLLQKKASFSAYLVSYRKQPVPTLQKQLPQTGDYPQSVATTWAMNFQEVEQTVPAATDLLSLSAFLAPDDIPYELLVHGAAYLGDRLSIALADATDDPLLLPELLEHLTRYSLIQVEPEQNCYSIHRMVQAVLRDRMETATQQQWVEQSVEALNATFPPVEFQTWQECDRLLPHVQAIWQHLKQYPYDSLSLAKLLHQTGRYLHDQAHYSEAETFYVKSLAIREQQLGTEHPDVATSLNTLAKLLRVLERYTEAEPLHLRSLAIREKELGTEHPDVATSCDDLAGLLSSQRRYDEAELLYLRALDIREKQLGTNHPHVAFVLNNLASLYGSQRRFDEAKLHYDRALVISKDFYGENAFEVAEILYNLATLHYCQEDYSKAEPLFLSSLNISEQRFGETHPHVAITVHTLANFYCSQRRYVEAEPLYLRALKTLLNCFGRDHHFTQQVQQDFCGLLWVVMWVGETGQLSDHPVTQDLLRQMREGRGE